MALSVPDKIAEVAEHFAKHDSHGYSQPNRGTGSTETITLSDGSKATVTNSDVDCSEMVRQCVNAALSGSYRSPISYMWTGDEDEKLRNQGFTRMSYAASKVKRGDILWVSGHTGVAVGNGKQADAHGDEVGGITGPRRGDQTGHEVEVRSLRSWTYIYRYGNGGSANTTVDAKYTLTVTTETNVRSAPSLSASVTGQLYAGDRILCDGITTAENKIWATYIANSGKRRYVSVGTQNAWVVLTQ